RDPRRHGEQFHPQQRDHLSHAPLSRPRHDRRVRRLRARMQRRRDRQHRRGLVALQVEPDLVGRGIVRGGAERRLELRGQQQPHLASSPPRLSSGRRARGIPSMIADALDSFAQIFSPPFRRVMAKSLGLTTAILVLAGVGLDRLALSLVHVGPAWVSAVLSIVVALGLVAGLIFLAPPTASLVAGFFLDEIAAIVERAIDPGGPLGRPLPIAPSLAMGLRFAVLSILVNLVVLLLTIFTGVGLVSFFVL